MDRHKQGRDKERLSMASCEALGCICWQPPRGKFTEQDIFGVGDFLVVQGASVFMVQVCHKKSKARHQKAIDAWNKEHFGALPCFLEVY